MSLQEAHSGSGHPNVPAVAPETASGAYSGQSDGSAADTLRRAADHLVPTPGHDYVAASWDEQEEQWRALLAPAVAEALAAWLREEADSAQAAQNYLDAHYGGVAPPGTWTTEHRHRHALTLGHLLLGEQP